MNNEIKIREFVNDEIKKLNILFQKGAEISKKKIEPFVIDDYTYLEESIKYFDGFSIPYLLSYSVLKDIEYRIKNPIPGNIWYWKNDADPNNTANFLPLQFELMYDTLDSYITLLRSEKFLQALILFRSYIEYSSQLYASLLDYDFFKKYANNEALDEEYKRLWFNSLKPAKVLSQIRNIHIEINQLLQKGEIEYGKNAIYRRIFQPFDSNLRGILYSTLSSLAHGSYPSLVKHDEVKLYALVWHCSSYLVESQSVIDEISSVYFKYTPKELLHKWVTIEIYMKAKESKVQFVY